MQNAIEVIKLSKSYKNIEAVKEIDFSVRKGSFFALLGVNGAGKSTTISIISTLIRKTSGKVIVNGHHVDRDDHSIRRDIGIVYQGNMLDKYLTVKENIIGRGVLYGLSRQEIEAKLLRLAPRIGVDDILGRRYGRLSGGQKRRADIARALINDPKILILDEPTTGLDPYTRKRVWETIQKLRKETELTIFLTTHYLEEAAGADEIVILDSGQIKASGSPEQLRLKYSSDKLMLVPRCSDKVVPELKKMGLGFIADEGRITVMLKNSFEALAIVGQIKDAIDGFEVVRGNLDDVFITITGRGKEELDQ